MPQRMEYDLPLLPPVGILSFLSSRSLGNLAQCGQYEKFETGETVIQEETEQVRLYIIVQGRLEISAMVSGQRIVLCEIEAGECLGEVSLFEPGPASASVTALEESIIWSLDSNELTSYLSEHIGGGGALLMGTARCLSQRLRLANQTVAKYHLQEQASTVLVEQTSAPLRVNTTETTGSFFEKLNKKFGADGRKPKIPTEIKI